MNLSENTIKEEEEKKKVDFKREVERREQGMLKRARWKGET